MYQNTTKNPRKLSDLTKDQSLVSEMKTAQRINNWNWNSQTREELIARGESVYLYVPVCVWGFLLGDLNPNSLQVKS